MDTSLQNAAAAMFKRAQKLDLEHRCTESLICYEEGIELLLNTLKTLPDGTQRSSLTADIKNHLERAEKLKLRIRQQKEEGRYHEQVEILDGSTGHSYQALFGHYMKGDITEISVFDSYIRNSYQCMNFVRFCELCVSKCKSLKRIALTTTREPEDSKKGEVSPPPPPASTNSSSSSQKCFSQTSRFQELANSLLKQYDVILNVTYSSNLHDREIRLNNGWIIKIGRGLNYFQSPSGKFSIGTYDLSLRKCLRTTVNIFHSKSVTYTK